MPHPLARRSRARFWLTALTIPLLVAACSAATPTASQPPAAGTASTVPASPAPSVPTPIDTVGPTEFPTASAGATASPASNGEPWIAYQGGASAPGRIRLVHQDGSDDHEVAPDVAPGRDQLHPDWSHDGTRLAFAADDADGTRDIWIVNVDGSEPRLVFECEEPCGWSDDPAWSPDDQSLLFDRAVAVDGGPDGVSTLEVLDLESAELRTVFTAGPADYLYVPRWSPDGGSVVVEITRFASSRLDEDVAVGSTVGTVDLATSDPEFQPLLPFESFASGPDWHPSGDRIAFALPESADRRPPEGSGDVFTIGSDGSDQVQVTNFADDGGFAIQPAWSPDGESILFTAVDSVADGAPNVASIAPDGSRLLRLNDECCRTHPRLQPPVPPAPPAATATATATARTGANQGLLAYEWFSGRAFKDVVTIRQDGTGRRALAAGIEPGQDHAVLDWSPDGQTIAFVVGEWYEGTSIWTVGADGQGATQIIGPSGGCRLGVNFPAYSPQGDKLMYVCQDGDSGDDPVGILTVLDFASGDSTEIARVQVPDELLFPRWSRDGRTAVAELRQWDTAPAEDVWTGSQIATVPITGGDFERLTAADMWAGDPDWSPTADEIVFGTNGISIKDMSKPSTIYLMQPDGSGQIVIAESAGDGLTRLTGPRWTPDGQRLLISIAVGEGTEVTDVKLAFLDLDGAVTRIPFGSEDLSGVGARLQPRPTQ